MSAPLGDQEARFVALLQQNAPYAVRTDRLAVALYRSNTPAARNRIAHLASRVRRKRPGLLVTLLFGQHNARHAIADATAPALPNRARWQRPTLVMTRRAWNDQIPRRSA